ncbi:MAG: hypothetical protein KDA20_02150 [Phycisphaerales bacterium]|nr:hypothetical protein [Phycisphaerales bacterium]
MQQVDPTNLAPGQSPSTLVDSAQGAVGALDMFHAYIGVFIVAFLLTVCLTPLMRKLAISQGIVDRPTDPRKAHRIPVAYLGGLAVFVGVLGGIAFSYIGEGLPTAFFETHESRFEQRAFPLSIVVGMVAITITGLLDDAAGLFPRLKIVGQLLAAAALAMNDIGVKVAAGFMQPIGSWLFDNAEMVWHITVPAALTPLLGPEVQFDAIYWTGTIIIAVFVLGGCNASNLIDGLDGLLSGVTAVAAAGLLIVALHLAVADDGPLDSARVILALALLGACLGFLPHNFNPATIFLGDCGSLLLGYLSIVLILSLGDTGKTHLVIAGLIIYAIPIIDTFLAIVRRKLAGKPLSAADDQHLHHMLKRALGVKGAVFALYGIGAVFAGLGLWLTEGRVRVVLTVALVFGAFITVTAVKVARRQAIESAAQLFDTKPTPAVEEPTVPGAEAAHAGAPPRPAPTS